MENKTNQNCHGCFGLSVSALLVCGEKDSARPTTITTHSHLHTVPVSIYNDVPESVLSPIWGLMSLHH